MTGRTGAGGACLLTGLFATILIVSTLPVRATSLIRMDLPQLVKAADRVVLARAVDKRVYWKERQIFTDTDFEVLDEAKGRGPRRVTVSLLGGRIDPLDMAVEGTPVFGLGEEFILFTEPLPDGKKHIAGFSQGVMRVRKDPATGAKTAISDVLMPVEADAAARGVGGEARSSRHEAPLAQALGEIRRLAQAGAAGETGLSKTPSALEPAKGERGNR